MSERKPVQCIGIILDGNRRWAVARGLPKLEGHRRGYDRVLDCARWVRDRGVKHLTVYAFSTENWNRAEEEVSYLMNLLRDAAEKSLQELAKENVRIRFIGTLERLSGDLRKAINAVEEASKENDKFTLWICLSYGSRAEIVAAAQAMAETGEPMTEESLRDHFWSAEMPDPDIVIRPSGEKRLSNFLLWQAAYSELFFIDSYWPDFSEALLDGILQEYEKRERRLGK